MPLNHKQIGSLGEVAAQDYLLTKGYSLVEKNFRVKQGELDIIAMDPVGCMAIIEVKTNTSKNAGTPESWVTPKKIHQINKVAKIYIALRARHIKNIRFDVISVDISRGNCVIKHFENAFIPVVNSR